jgi:isoleucyl-tRNA synthetase
MAVPSESINFPVEEEKILEFWKRIDAFKNSLQQSSAGRRPR